MSARPGRPRKPRARPIGGCRVSVSSYSSATTGLTSSIRIRAPSDDAVARGEEFCAKIQAFCEESVDGAQIERDARIPDDVIRGLASIGAFGMKIAPEYGGLGLTNLYYNRALIIAGSASPAVAALLSAHQSIGVPQPLAQFGTDEQKQQFLPQVRARVRSAPFC